MGSAQTGLPRLALEVDRQMKMCDLCHKRIWPWQCYHANGFRQVHSRCEVPKRGDSHYGQPDLRRRPLPRRHLPKTHAWGRKR